MNRLALLLSLTMLLSACGAETGSQGKQTIDVTPSNVQNIVQDTGAKANAAVEQGKEAIDKAVDAADSPKTK